MLQFAKRMDFITASEIREILKVTENPEIISFAGGLPAPELFPVEEMREVSAAVLKEAGKEVLQYGTTEGFPPLREIIATRMNHIFKTDFTAAEILITNGSQQGLDLSGKIFLNEGDAVFCESPTYLAAINALRVFMPQFVEVPTDTEGMIIPELERLLDNTPHAKLIYLIPNFQNPSGGSWSARRREEFMEVVNRHEIAVIEDNPYGELRFDGEFLPSVQSWDKKSQVICLGTFSKTLCPGFRVGWVAARPRILEKFNLVKQSADLHTSTVSQREIARYIREYDFQSHIEQIKATYKRRRDVMLQAMESEFPPEIRFTHPQGGLFIWVELPPHINARDALIESLKAQVAFVPGGAFFPNGGKEHTLRLNFSNMPEERIREGIKRLGGVLRRMMAG